MPTPMTSPHATELEFQRALGCVFVTNFERALTFYCDKLGFEVRADMTMGTFRWRAAILG